MNCPTCGTRSGILFVDRRTQSRLIRHGKARRVKAPSPGYTQRRFAAHEVPRHLRWRSWMRRSWLECVDPWHQDPWHQPPEPEPFKPTVDHRAERTRIHRAHQSKDKR